MKRILQSMIGIIVVSLSACGTIESPSRSNANLTVTPSPAPTTVAYPAPPPVQPPSLAPTESARNQRPVIIPPCEFDATAATPTPSGRTLESWQFSEPELILEGKYVIASQWLPDNQRVLYMQLDEGKPTTHIRSINVVTKAMTDYGTRTWRNELPVWSERANGVLFTTMDTTSNDVSLVLSRGDQQSPQPVIQFLEGTRPPDISPSGTQMVVYTKGQNRPTRYIDHGQGYEQATMHAKVNDTLDALADQRLLPTHWAWNSTEDQALIYGINRNYLVNFTTNSVCAFRLATPQPNQWIYDARWSPDGRQIALLITEGHSEYGLSYTELALFDTLMGTVQIVDTPTNYMSDMRWLDDHFLLGKVAISDSQTDTTLFQQGNKEQLAIFDMFRNSNKLINTHQRYTNGKGFDLSPSKKYILIQQSDTENYNHTIFRIEVKEK